MTTPENVSRTDRDEIVGLKNNKPDVVGISAE